MNKIFVRTKNKSISICVKANGDVVIKYPYNVPLKKVEMFVASKKEWIDKKVKATNLTLEYLQKVLTFECALMNGDFITIREGKYNLLDGEVLYYTDKKAIQNLIFSKQQVNIENMVKEIAEIMNCGEFELRFKKYKSCWGLCSANKKIITLNTAMAMLPIELQKYIIYHELVHLAVPNHGKMFWWKLQSYLPEAKIFDKELIRYVCLTRLYY